MPITFGHLPLIALQFWAVLLPLIIGGISYVVPAFRHWAKRLVFGSMGSVGGMVAYQIGYIPVLLALGGAIFLCAFVARQMGATSMADSVTGIGLLLVFYVIWFLVMILGYISGFRVGSARAAGVPLRVALQKDYFVAAYCRRKEARSPK